MPAQVEPDHMVFERDGLTDSELQGFEADGVNASLIFVDNRPGQGRRLHRHPYHEIFIVLEGHSTPHRWLGDAERHCSTGHCGASRRCAQVREFRFGMTAPDRHPHELEVHHRIARIAVPQWHDAIDPMLSEGRRDQHRSQWSPRRASTLPAPISASPTGHIRSDLRTASARSPAPFLRHASVPPDTFDRQRMSDCSRRRHGSGAA
jgi:hypothetical protein